MKTIIFFYTDRIGEAEGFFTPEGELLCAWSCNDASYRDEYMSPLFEALGIKVLHFYSDKKKIKLSDQYMAKKLAENFGETLDDE